MNILVINWQDRLNPLAGGAEVHLHEVFSRIAAMGHRVVLLCSSFPGASAEQKVDGMEVVRTGGRSLFNFAVPAAYRALRDRIRFDVVVDDVNKIPFLTPKFVQEPLVGVAHHFFGGSIFREVNPVSAGYVYAAERVGIATYRRAGIPFIIGSSQSAIEEMVNEGFRREDLTLVSPAVDAALFESHHLPKHPTPLIGAFGRLKKYKSVDHLLQAIPLIARDVPGVKAVIVGEGDDRPRLESLVRSLGLAQKVTFTGFVPPEVKIRWLREMWVKVATSKKEGWGLTVTEANACGTPVVASDVPGLRDAVQSGKAGILYPYGDIPALASAVSRLLLDASLRNRYAEEGVKWAATFNWDTAARTALGVLEKGILRGSVAKR